jgi:hypothetical protein
MTSRSISDPEAFAFTISERVEIPGTGALKALLDFNERVDAGRLVTPAVQAIEELLGKCIPTASMTSARLLTPDLAEVRFPVLGKASELDNGVRYVTPTAIPLLLVLSFFGKDQSIYVMNTTSKKRRDAGHRRLHYVYIFSAPDHIPLERVLADARVEERVEFINDHHYLLPSNFSFSPDSRRSGTGRQEAIERALGLYDEARNAGWSRDLSRDSYRVMLNSAFRLYGHSRQNEH